MEHLMRWLPAHMPADDGLVSLIHGDYRLDNLIFHPEQARVLAVLDWELSTLGHPLADLAYFCMCLRLPRTERIKGLAGMPLADLGIPDEQALVDRYCELRGIPAISNLNFYLAFSMFRLASICQGVMKRALDGNAASENAAATGRMAKPLAELGASLAV
jgi:aminoglycoside phosphotransferase (APT) family kinase protein